MKLRPLEVRHVKSHSLQSFLNGSWPPYFLNLCITGTSFLVREYSHLSQLLNLASCFTPLCILRVSFLVDVLSHEWHSNIVSSSSLGFIFRCALRVPFLIHTYSYQSHLFLYLSQPDVHQPNDVINVSHKYLDTTIGIKTKNKKTNYVFSFI